METPEITHYDYDFAKDNDYYQVTVDCSETPYKKSELHGDQHTKVSITKNGEHQTDLFLNNHCDNEDAKLVFSDVENNIDLILKNA